MTVLEHYLASKVQPDMFAVGAPGYDEFAGPQGGIRDGWAGLADGLRSYRGADLRRAQWEVARLLEDDGVTYTPGPAATVTFADHSAPPPGRPHEPQPLAEQLPWRLDPLPLVLQEREWSALEAGVVQRSELLDAIVADLYGAQKLLAGRHLPVPAVLDHDEYLRTMVGAPVSPSLFMVAVDLGRDDDGRWKVMSDRTQAPSGAGYAMQNRRVVSRVMPEVYHAAHLHRLTPFFQAMRTALVDAAPARVENPRVVVLSPGTLSETAFDQAFLASLLGFPLVEGRDLTVRDGRVWMRVLGKLEEVDVILRRVDSIWTDPLELRPGSRLGVAGLVECVRHGTVSVVNTIGSGIVENPALMPYLPDLCERLLGQPLRLPSVQTWWCGDPDSLRYATQHLDDLVIRPTSRGRGRSVRAVALSKEKREQVLAMIRANPHRFVAQQVLNLSSTPTTADDRLVPRNVVLRSFAVRDGASYTAMLGGLARVSDDADQSRGALVTAPGGGLAKDVWVVSEHPIISGRPTGVRVRGEGEHLAAPVDAASAAMVPRVLSDLFWFGRYAERAEDLLRLVLATRTVAIETDLDVTQGRALEVLERAVTRVSTTYPGFLTSGREMMPELRSLLLDRHRSGTAAQSLSALSLAAQGVRDQLSDDVWMVLADIERASAALAANPYDQGLQLTDASERILSGLLALAGIVSENMVRDAGWYMLDTGRGLERALQVLALLQATVCAERSWDTERLVVDAVLTASESIVTFRRRYRGRDRVEAAVELLVTDVRNPRSVAYQAERILGDLRAIPNASPTARPLRLADAFALQVRQVDLAELLGSAEGPSRDGRAALGAYLEGLSAQLRDLSVAIRDQYQQLPPTLQPMWGSGGGA
ncbi:circularly permuted type 2 ATP-grasp protein [Microlunatus aurantiacus]|uniref:Circularly permuted type 2 ATP-grasp protein n=2 Tax=Bacteria TaxID=2 RepID=A0ABP7CRA2_9ACTN